MVNFAEEARTNLRAHENVIPRSVADHVAEALAAEAVAYAPDARHAVVHVDRFRFHFSMFKLAGGLAASAQILLDPGKGSLIQGLGILAAAAAFSDSVRRLTIEEAAVCQSLWERRTATGLAVATYDELRDGLLEKTDDSQVLEKRLDAALASLERLQVIQRQLSSNTVELMDLMFVRKSRAIRQGDR